MGSYSKFPSPNTWNHGFIYNNGQLATLNYPDSTLQTILSGISNANLIVGTTIKGSTAKTARRRRDGVELFCRGSPTWLSAGMA